MGYRQKANSNCNRSLLVMTSIIVVANCGLIRDAAARVSLPAHHVNQYGDSALADDDLNHISISPTHNSNPWWRRIDRFLSIGDRDQLRARQVEPSPMEDEYGTVGRCNTSASISHRFGGTCGLAPRDPVNGERPSHVVILAQIVYTPMNGIYCGGTFVSDRHVLTAAHCIHMNGHGGKYRRLEPSQITLVFGDLSTMGPSEHRQISRAKSLCVPNEYDPITPNAHDWALIELEQPVAFTDYIQPACLPEDPTLKKVDTSRCWMVGLNANDMEAGPVQKVRVKKLPCDVYGSFAKARACYEPYEEPEDHECQYQSGGPVLCLDNQNRMTVVAVVSRGMTCMGTPPFLGAAYTDIMSLLKDVKTQCHI